MPRRKSTPKPAGRRRDSASRSSARSTATSPSVGNWRRAAGLTPANSDRAARWRPMPDLDIQELTTGAGLEALAPEWHDLWCRAGAAHPFQSPAWLIPWSREIGGGDLRVLVARRGGRMVGLLPMFRQNQGNGGKLLPLGIAISDYLDGLFEDGCGPE